VRGHREAFDTHAPVAGRVGKERGAPPTVVGAAEVSRIPGPAIGPLVAGGLFRELFHTLVENRLECGALLRRRFETRIGARGAGPRDGAH